jgi:hypothetical protein
LGLFRKKKEKPPEEKKTVTDLKILCGEDKEVYEALRETMLLDPKRVSISLEEAEKKAKEFEKSGNLIQAKMEYFLAGGLAIYQGDTQKVIECFGKCQELSGKSYPILKMPEKAVAKAQEYYRKYLKPEKKE